MGAQEVVMSYEQSSQRDSAIRAIKAVRRLHVVFISSVKALNDLFKGSEFCGFFIEVLKADDFMVLDIETISRVGIDEVNTGGV